MTPSPQTNALTTTISVRLTIQERMALEASALARIDPGLLAKIGPPTFRDTPATDEDSRGADG
jgi:hypothetical protein